MDNGQTLTLKIDNEEEASISESGSHVGEDNLMWAWNTLRTGKRVIVSSSGVIPAVFTLTCSIGGKTALDWAMKQDFHCGCWLMEKPEAAMKAITRNLDRGIWRDLMKKSGMLSLMDAAARDQWYNSLEKDCIPVVSEENILNTFI